MNRRDLAGELLGWAPAPLKDAVLRRAKELGGCAGKRVPVFTGRGFAYWIDLLAHWEADAIAMSVAALHPAAEAAVREGAGAEALILFTSGSTGESKGVVLSPRAIWANAVASAEALGLSAGSRLFVPIPFTFVSALSHFLVALRAGADFVGREGGLLPGEFLRELRGATAVGGAPLHLRWIRDAAESGHRFPLRWLMASGDRLAPEVARGIREAYPDARLNIVYGMTELAGRACALNAAEGAEHTVGRPLPGLRARVGEGGEIQFHGEFLMDGYVGRGREGFTGDGWLRTGDVGEIDGEGRVILQGRRDDVFKCSGLKVSGVRIAEALMATGFFADAWVVPEPHPVFGHVAHALVVPKGPWDEGEVARRLRETLPDAHIPRRFSERKAIPRTPSGKVRRAEL